MAEKRSISVIPKGTWLASIELSGTYADTFAPFGTEANDPHTRGESNSPENAIAKAYELLGRWAARVKT